MYTRTTPVVNLPMMRLVYFTLKKQQQKKNNNNKKHAHEEIDAIITYACFGINLVEIGGYISAASFLWMGSI